MQERFGNRNAGLTASKNLHGFVVRLVRLLQSWPPLYAAIAAIFFSRTDEMSM